jgi:hypothetical protein
LTEKDFDPNKIMEKEYTAPNGTRLLLKWMETFGGKMLMDIYRWQGNRFYSADQVQPGNTKEVEGFTFVNNTKKT